MATSLALPPRSGSAPHSGVRVRPPAAAKGWNWQLDAPAWLVSMLVHLVVLLLLGLAAVKMNGTGAPMFATLVASNADGRAEEGYFDDDQPAAIAMSAAAAGGGAPQSASDIIGQESPVSPQGVLPAALAGAPALGDGPGDAIGTDVGITDGTGQTNQVPGSLAKTKVYGIEGTGSKFVFVFDCSDSMNSYDRAPIRSAKAELIAAIQPLGKVHEFQIIFYNQTPTIMRLASREGDLVVGDDATKRLAERYIEGVPATGGTNHFDALELALRFGPDVIFFLTDADQPGLSEQQLREITRSNRAACSIHTIEFDVNESPTQNNFLQRLAKANRGEYRYLNISQLRKRSS